MKRGIIFGIISVGVGCISLLSIVLYHFFYPQQYVRLDNGQYVRAETVANQQPFPIDQECSFVMEYYYPEENRLLREDIEEIPDLLGCNKEGVEKYLKRYMSTLSKEEKENGLVSFSLTGYRNKQITLRKTYRKNVKKGYYAKSFNGNIVILNSDEKTVYDYTPIMLNHLPKDLQEKVQHGYYLESEESLYNFLENYSS
ncbi:MAG: hypothetical protein Q4D51_10390 [Eubacteriales bacterium]|nr:hypothetical protein [Eubacteriales bacterium]